MLARKACGGKGGDSAAEGQREVYQPLLERCKEKKCGSLSAECLDPEEHTAQYVPTRTLGTFIFCSLKVFTF